MLIGGTSIFGGRATIVGTVFGCFIIGMIEAGLVAAGLTGAWVRTVQGLIFLISIIFYMSWMNRSAGALLSPTCGRSADWAASARPKGEAFAAKGVSQPGMGGTATGVPSRRTPRRARGRRDLKLTGAKFIL